ncbi:hypothetical protein [Lunatimonas salinarum]|uniref:hypothetical protein n=1 Tax=Lunatimonas salinarum TaxID=1774590 RepID=UPI001ADF467E|nr:hypothetical protein [Lunatimonas salinarum]
MSYQGATYSFQLERTVDLGFPKTSAYSSGVGFRQTTGELDYVFSQVWGDYQYMMDPKWNGEIFNFTLRFSGREMDLDLFLEVTEEIRQQSGIYFGLKEERIAAECIQVNDQGALTSHTYRMEDAVLEVVELSDGMLMAKGMTLDGLVNYLNGLRDEKYYFYEGVDSEKYSFELNVSNPEKLERSLKIYGISLENCQVNVQVVEIK